MFKENKNLLVVAIVALVNALGYGIIIPILYSYSQKFGLSDFQNGLLFATFSICQFVSTPIIGMLSDKYGRKPLLVFSVAGTALSFLMMASAPSALFLFIARALDGITAGNIPVISAIISDTTDEKNRAKGFGIIGATFGLGFVFGPSISALTVGISESLPFIIAAAISVIAVILTIVILPETNKHIGKTSHHKLFDIKKMIKALGDQNIGNLLLITLIYSMAFSMFIYAYQPFSVKVLNLNTNNISLLFTLFGVVGLLAQSLLVQPILTKLPLKSAYPYSIIVVAFSFALMFLSSNIYIFIISSILLGLSNAIVNPLTQTILSEETDSKSQGAIMGLQAAYMSIGQIIGPIAGGVLATLAIRFPFLGGSLTTLTCVYLSTKVFNKEKPVSL